MTSLDYGPYEINEDMLHFNIVQPPKYGHIVNIDYFSFANSSLQNFTYNDIAATKVRKCKTIFILTKADTNDFFD